MDISNEILFPTITGFIGVIVGVILSFLSELIKDYFYKRNKLRNIQKLLRLELTRILKIIDNLNGIKSQNGEVSILKNPFIVGQNYFDIFIDTLSSMQANELEFIIKAYNSITDLEEVRSKLDNGFFDIKFSINIDNADQRKRTNEEVEYQLHELRYSKLLDQTPLIIRSAMKVLK